MHAVNVEQHAAIATEILRAREKAHAKHGANSIEAIPATDLRWLSILVEEVGEAAHELTYDADGDLRAELVDIASVVMAWISALDAKRPATIQDFGRMIADVTMNGRKVGQAKVDGSGSVEATITDPRLVEHMRDGDVGGFSIAQEPDWPASVVHLTNFGPAGRTELACGALITARTKASMTYAEITCPDCMQAVGS